MPDRPLLILPIPGETLKRQKRSGGPDTFSRPSVERQTERLTPRFKLLEQAIRERRARLESETHALQPEEVVVLETVGSVDDFIRVVERIPGMEWLAEVDKEQIPPDDDFFVLDAKGKRRTEKDLKGRLFLVFLNQAALEQLLSLWNSWSSKQRLRHGLKKWERIFEQLRDVRRWGVQDRLLETGILDDWEERADYGEDVVPCEIELWYRSNTSIREESVERVVEYVNELDGQVLQIAEIEEIAYHALLVKLPIERISVLVDSIHDDAKLIQCEHIQFFRACGQMSAISNDGVTEQDVEDFDRTGAGRGTDCGSIRWPSSASAQTAPRTLKDRRSR